jgi:hypothetical protein
MFTTSLAAATVAGLLASGTLVGQPDWAPNYSKAMAIAAEHRKPVAVFLTQGGLAHLTKGDGLGSAATKALRTDYVAVHIDTTTEAGKKLSDAFGITEGVVISDRNGGKMALRHEGLIAPAELSGYLTKYSSGSAVAVTEYRAAGRPMYTPVPAQVYQQPRPVLNAIQNFNTAVFGGPIFGGS